MVGCGVKIQHFPLTLLVTKLTMPCKIYRWARRTQSSSIVLVEFRSCGDGQRVWFTILRNPQRRTGSRCQQRLTCVDWRQWPCHTVKASRLPCSDGCPDSDEWPSLYDARQPCPLSWSVRDDHGSRTPPETRHGTPSTFCCRWLGWRTSWSRPDNSTTRSLPVNTLSSLMPDLLTVNEYSPHSISFNIYGWQ